MLFDAHLHRDLVIAGIQLDFFTVGSECHYDSCYVCCLNFCVCFTVLLPLASSEIGQFFSCTNKGIEGGEGANDRTFMEVKGNWKNTVLAVKEEIVFSRSTLATHDR